MPLSDDRFRAAVIAGAAGLAALLGTARFCGEVSLPPPPDRAAAPAAASRDPVARAAGPPMVEAGRARYRDHVRRAATAAGVRAPTLEELGQRLPYRGEEARHILEVGQRPLAVAGLALRALRTGDSLALEIHNPAASALAYRVVATPTPEIAGCADPPALPFDAMVIGPGRRETRIECAWRDGMALVVTHVEVVALTPLAAWHVAQVPPTVVGIDDRIARGHQPPAGSEQCPPVLPQAVTHSLESGEITWRDLIDFYARHSCHIYQFPITYRAFSKDGALALPAADDDG